MNVFDITFFQKGKRMNLFLSFFGMLALYYLLNVHLGINRILTIFIIAVLFMGSFLWFILKHANEFETPNTSMIIGVNKGYG